MIIFTHIPKTAGTSLIRNILREKMSKEDKRFSIKNGKEFKDYLFGNKKIKERPKCVSGHFPFGIHRCFNAKKYSYFTFLRNPIDRWISHFLYSLDSGHDDIIALFYKKCINRNKNLVYFLKKCHKKEILCNIMTKQLSGLEKPENLILSDKAKITGCYYVPSLCGGKKKYTEEEMENMLFVAKQNLKNRYDFIGFQERYNNDLIRFCNFYKIKKPHINKKWRVGNFEKHKKIRSSLKDKDIINLIYNMNSYDIQLYKYAKKSL